MLLTSARTRLRNAKEEKEQFDDASNEIIVHLKTKVQKSLIHVHCYEIHNMRMSFYHLL
jgi:hypothetical protein